MPGHGDWVLLDAVQFVNNLFLSLKNDDPLLVTMRRIFTEVLGKMMRYAGCTHGIHLLSNRLNDPNNKLAALEIDHLYVDPSTTVYTTSALMNRQAARGKEAEDGLPHYVRITERDYKGAVGLDKELRELLGGCMPWCCSAQQRDRWDPIFEELDKARRPQADSHRPSPLYAPLAWKEAMKLLVIPLATGS